MRILSIETSCDDTGVAVLENNKVISNVVASQTKTFKKYGGVIPELASRMHAEKINELIDLALTRANTKAKELDYIAFTQGPGLINTLQVGLVAAKTLSQYLDIPIIPVNHLEGHIYSPYIDREVDKKTFNNKKLAILVSGGHTQLIEINKGKYKLIGTTSDDTIGEAFDKVGSMIGVSYPGGPAIDRLAKKGKDTLELKVSKLSDYRFSYSGLKSQVRRKVQEGNYKNEDVAHSFQKAAVQQIEWQVKKYLKSNDVDEILVTGGVSANSYLRETMAKISKEVKFPKLKYCQDNAAMIGNAAYIMTVKGYKPTKEIDMDSYPRTDWK